MRDIIERDKTFAAMNIFHNENSDNKFYNGLTYSTMKKCYDPFSTTTSLKDLLRNHIDTQYFKEVAKYVKDSDEILIMFYIILIMLFHF